MKPAYLWVVDWSFADPDRENPQNQVTADLFFSSPDKFRELYTASDWHEQQLVAVQVPDNFEWWDFIPDNY